MTFEPPTLTLRYGNGRDALEGERVDPGVVPQVPTFAEIVEAYPVVAGASCVCVAGSVVLGWGHAFSDLDLYVLSERPLEPDPRLEIYQREVSTEDPAISIAIGEVGPYRLDFEFWRTGQVDEIVGRFSGDVVDQEAPELDKTEQDMLYRLVSGRALHGEGWWRACRERILASHYGHWFADNRKLKAESGLEDVAGMLASGDREAALLASHETFTLALEALLATYGDFSVTRKWLHRRLLAYEPREIDAELAWRTLTMHGAAEDPGGVAEHTAVTAQRLLVAVERKTL
jgi:hypothetical protein